MNVTYDPSLLLRAQPPHGTANDKLSATRWLVCMFAKHPTAGLPFFFCPHMYIRASVWMECTYTAMQQADADCLPH